MADNKLLEKVLSLQDKFQSLQDQLSSPEAMSDMKKYVQLNKDYKELEPIIAAGKEYKKMVDDLAAAKAGHQRGTVGFDGLGREGAEQGGGGGAPPQALGQGPMVGLEAGTIVRGKRGADDPLLGVLAEAGAQGLGGRGEVGQRRAAELRQEGLEGLPQIVLGEGGGRVRHGSANRQRWARRRWYSSTRRRIRRPGSGSRGHWR